LVCVSCADAREKGQSTEVAVVCKECFEYATTEVGDLVRAGGRPETHDDSACFNDWLIKTVIPSNGSMIVDIAPIDQESQSIWLMLAEDGRLLRHDTHSGKSEVVGQIRLPSESARDPFAGHTLAQRLHVSHDGEFAAVVSDYGQYGQVIDLRSGKITLKLDGGKYHPETVPFSFRFASWQGRVVVIHRTAWNRLDVSDASSGQLLSERGPTAYQKGEQRPEHYLDYFHGALYLSPKGTRILDDGWVWHPVGIPVVWSVDQWLSGNIWESEDGKTKRDVCARNYYWDHGVAWINEETVAIGGIGDDETEIVDGARIFDITSTGPASPEWRSDWQWAREVTAFAGPAGRFFSDGKWLYSASKSGMSRWDPKTGTRTGHIDQFNPTHHHVGAGELAQLSEGAIVRWSTSSES
jgi:hypothetical protein